MDFKKIKAATAIVIYIVGIVMIISMILLNSCFDVVFNKWVALAPFVVCALTSGYVFGNKGKNAEEFAFDTAITRKRVLTVEHLKRRMKIVLISSFVVGAIGVAVLLWSGLSGNKNEDLSGISILLILFTAMGASAYLGEIEKNGGPEKYITEKLDERNIMIKTKAKSIAFSICSPIIIIAFLMLRMTGAEYIMDIVPILGVISISIISAYGIALAILKKKY